MSDTSKNVFQCCQPLPVLCFVLEQEGQVWLPLFFWEHCWSACFWFSLLPHSSTSNAPTDSRASSTAATRVSTVLYSCDTHTDRLLFCLCMKLLWSSCFWYCYPPRLIKHWRTRKNTSLLSCFSQYCINQHM